MTAITRAGASVFFVALSVGSASGVLDHLFSFPLLEVGGGSAALDAYQSVLHLSALALNPVLLFVVLYRIGAGYDLRRDYKDAALSLLVGALAGLFLGGSLFPALLPFSLLGSPHQFTFVDMGAFIILAAIDALYSMWQIFLVGFAAIALGFLNGHRTLGRRSL